MIEEEFIKINGKMETALVKEVTVCDGKGSGRINVPTGLIGSKFRMILI